MKYRVTLLWDIQQVWDADLHNFCYAELLQGEYNTLEETRKKGMEVFHSREDTVSSNGVESETRIGFYIETEQGNLVEHWKSSPCSGTLYKAN